jgi:ubiquinone/menaquinone biosynthesis C-methylase UbiE
MIYPESPCAHHWIDPLCVEGARGIEIGGSLHNPFNFPFKQNVDYTDSTDTLFKQEEIKRTGGTLPVDIVAFADDLPFTNETLSYLIASHVFEHQPNPIRALAEWYRVLRPGGVLYLVIPFRHAAPEDRSQPLTTLGHIINDFFDGESVDTHETLPGHGKYGHYHTFSYNSFSRLLNLFNEMVHDNKKVMAFKILETLFTDDKVPNGFVYVLKRI